MNRTDCKVGDTVHDTITGFEGVVVCRSEWLNGCVRLTVQPRKLHEGKPIDSQTFDVEQLEPVEPALRWKTPNQVRAATGGDRETIRRAPDPK
jgi:hypothetical protein